MTVAVVGSGVVGVATGRGLGRHGHGVVFCDVSTERLAILRGQGLSAVEPAGLGAIAVDAYLISVPTPTVEGRVDLSYVREAASAVGGALGTVHRRGRARWSVAVIRSTVPPGTTEDLVIPTLASASGLNPGRDFGVCVNPEFLRAASAEEDFARPRVIVIGALDRRSEMTLRHLYAPWAGVPVVTTSLRTAEAAKYVANLFNAAKISFFNEMDQALLALGAEPEDAFAAAALGAEGLWNPRYGTRGGSPYGGVCLPKDTLAFRGLAEERGLGHLVSILRATIDVNERMEAELRREAGHPVVGATPETSRAPA